MKNRLNAANLDALRNPQRLAVQAILRNIENGKQSSAIVLPCRVGKTDVARVTAYEAVRLGLAPACLMFVTSDQLRTQATDAGKTREAAKRYGFTAGAFRYVAIRDSRNAQPFVNGEMFAVTTIQLGTTGNFQLLTGDGREQEDFWPDLVRSMIEQTGLAPIVIFDECHTIEQDAAWGDFVLRMHLRCRPRARRRPMSLPR